MYYNQGNESTNLSVDDLLAQATASVVINDQIVGTAWLVGNDGELLTAGHLLGEDYPIGEVIVQFAEDVPRKAHQVNWGYQPDRGIDFAVLKLQQPPSNRRPLPISLAQSVEGRFRLLGYGRSLVHRSTGYGEFTGLYDLNDNSSYRLFRLRSAELTEGGYSGGAVFSETLQAVVGIQVEAMASVQAGRDTVFAMPLYRIVPHWRPLANLDSSANSSSQGEQEQLYRILLNSGYFNDDHTMRSLLADSRLSTWRGEIPLEANPSNQVKQIVNLLSHRFNRQGVNGLTLLLQVLLDRLHERHPTRQKIQQLLNERERGPEQASSSPPSSSGATYTNAGNSSNAPGCNFSLNGSYMLLTVSVLAVIATAILIGLTEAVILGGVAVALLVGYYFYDQVEW